MQRVSQVLTRLDVAFDDPKSVASAGLLLPMSLAQQLNIEPTINTVLPSTGYGGHRNGGAKALTMVSSFLAGGEFISDVSMLASGSTRRVLGHRAVSASRCGQWLRELTYDDTVGLTQVNTDLMVQAWQCGLAPAPDGGAHPKDTSRLVLDIDSTVIETYGTHKEGTSKRNYQGIKGYHPLIMAEASTGQVLCGMLRNGNAAPAKDAAVFLNDTFTQIAETLTARDETVLRADSGFYTKKVIDTCVAHNVGFSITVRNNTKIRQVIASINQDAYHTVPTTGFQQMAVTEVPYTVTGRTGKDPVECRLIVRRTTVPADTGEPQSRLFDLVDYRGFVTNLKGKATNLDRFHRKHAVIETVIRDLKYGMALNHMPSGSYHANAGWLQLNILAHNLARWTGRLISDTPMTTKTLRHRYLNCPGRITRNSRKDVLHLPTNWPWKTKYVTALNRIRTLQTAH
ncbi:MAG: IS1380 family transposase [Acidimicrobiia bacterium]|nr:IS1380 family transposase [Acidimicrobiia bacterium]